MTTRRCEHPLAELVEAQKAGRAVGAYSICSANRYVLEAAMLEAQAGGGDALIESTSNQVDQFGGYSGMRPADFVAWVREAARGIGFPAERVILGGDHLGPNPWQREPAEGAMAKARDLVRAYVEAGYTKIHLDASPRCADDGGESRGALPVETVAARAAELCVVAEQTHSGLGSAAPLVYVIGTEVPVPGGAQEELREVAATRVEDAQETLALTRQAFRARGLESAWERVMAVVVQPGVEFGDAAVVPYDRRKARALAAHIEGVPGIVYEAHSTDYQTRGALREMVEDHFAVLKVGPALTFAFREAVFALEAVELEWLGGREAIGLSRVGETLERVMRQNPAHWKDHYHGDEAARRYARKYSYSDRSRYYWPHPDLRSALQRLLTNLEASPAPLTLLSQYLPAQYRAVRNGAIRNAPAELIRHKIREVTGDYAFACGV
jgi:D-tagatose-1,6-bisphosphate aldolase subunit GatZ/KbaZ